MPPASLAVGALLALVLVALRLAASGLGGVLALAVAHVVILAFQPVGDALLRYLEDQARAAERRGAALLLRRHRRAGRRHRAGASRPSAELPT